MPRTIKHFDLHQVEGAELRVVSDVESGVFAVLEAEDEVVRRYAARELWRHDWVDLFILQDLQVLAEQLAGAGGLPPGGTQALDRRPVVNAFDLRDLSGCHVFVNHKVMVEEGYWGDPAAVRALLAHEHAHPLSENPTVAASRALRVRSSQAPAAEAQPALNGRPSLERLAAALAEKLCCYGPREVFANDLAIAAGCGDDLFHLDELVVAAAARGVLGRYALVDLLEADVAQGKRPRQAAGQALLLGDLRSCLDLAMEIAPFYRAGRADQAARLEAMLFEQVFPRLESPVEGTYQTVRDLYVDLGADLTGAALVTWAGRVLDPLLAALRERGLELDLSFNLSEKEEGTHA
ncbi:MAG: M48 family metalloprotease [Actinomycetes bacterium]